MALESKYKITNLTDAVVYCNGTDDEAEYPVKGAEHGWTLREIVKKAISMLEVDTKDKSNDEVYKAYCSKLESKVKGGQTYCNSMLVSENNNSADVITSFKEMIPIQNDSLEFKCKETVEKAFKGVDLSFGKGFLSTSDKKTIKINEFIVMQVIRSGYCIDIIPTYIEFNGIAEGHRILFYSDSKCSASIDYRQTRYTLNRSHVQAIIKMLDDDEKNPSF